MPGQLEKLGQAKGGPIKFLLPAEYLNLYFIKFYIYRCNVFHPVMGHPPVMGHSHLYYLFDTFVILEGKSYQIHSKFNI